ncbi:MAG: 4Fe-4S ferredoxin iron-sulfur binding domain protein [Fibrobacteres bacterium]|nr:4Fe-4S ferredoxin iron-sulfur binding domain protein [Fibrobacterota bacterium]
MSEELPSPANNPEPAKPAAPVGAKPAEPVSAKPAEPSAAKPVAAPSEPGEAKSAAPAAAPASAPPSPPAAAKPAEPPAAKAPPAPPPPPLKAVDPGRGKSVEAADEKPSLRRFLGDAFSLIKGMNVTFRYIRKPSRTVTREYPENRDTLKFPERFRGQVVMPHDDNGDHTCTACTLCEKACPNGSISILTTKNIASKRVLGAFVYRLSSCTLCNLCIEACPFDAIRMGHGFEMATYSREPLDLILNKTEGR